MAALPAEAEYGVQAFLTLDGIHLLLFHFFDLDEFFKEVDCLSYHAYYIWILFEFFEGMRDDH